MISERDPILDFLSQMHLAVWENCPLWELPRGSTDIYSRHRRVVHGPWPAESCAAVQRLWFRTGWVGLYYPTLPAQWNLVVASWRERTAADGTLGSADAEELLAHTERWVLGMDDGHVELFLTDEGHAEPWEQWYDTALPLVSTLDLTVASENR
ncbi:MAG TPA: hypothetical protein VH561_04260 [Micromonosporaceae bacterium]|jgi:hypothetical protein